MSTTDIITTLLGLANIVLLVRRSIWNYPFGLALVAVYGWVFLGARLYSDAALQVFFFVVQIYGWWNWYRARDSEGQARVEAMSWAARAIWCGVIAAVTVAEGWYLANHTGDAAPWMDANITAVSVVAQYLLSVRKIENWILWIATDVMQIGLYYHKALYQPAALYVVFLILSVVGFLQWRRQLAPVTA
jgi:nicotinamide mononucleotide transporter